MFNMCKVRVFVPRMDQVSGWCSASVKRKGDNLIEEDSEFSQRELMLFKELFTRYDRDENQKLDRWEFTNFAKFIVGRSVKSVDLEKIFSKMDRNKDGYITWTELIDHLEKRHSLQKQEKYFDAFCRVDHNQEGKIAFWQVKLALKDIGVLHGDYPSLRPKFEAADSDEDGKITFHEFQKIIFGYMNKRKS